VPSTLRDAAPLDPRRLGGAIHGIGDGAEGRRGARSSFLAFLITAARTQLDEAAKHGPLRLLTAARRLADFMTERASPAMRDFLAGPFEDSRHPRHPAAVARPPASIPVT